MNPKNTKDKYLDALLNGKAYFPSLTDYNQYIDWGEFGKESPKITVAKAQPQLHAATAGAFLQSHGIPDITIEGYRISELLLSFSAQTMELLKQTQEQMTEMLTFRTANPVIFAEGRKFREDGL